MDRNWNELLHELRVTQAGTQILTAVTPSVEWCCDSVGGVVLHFRRSSGAVIPSVELVETIGIGFIDRIAPAAIPTTWAR